VEYNFNTLEKDIKTYWQQHHTYTVDNNSDLPKYYVLDMFPYPSGSGLHVGHPLGYIASDIYARYKTMKGFNVLHPMGFDAFGLPAEQYALETGQHPAVTTEQNIARYKEQLNNIGFNYDWSREIRTSDEKYYQWTQWIFMQLFHSWFNTQTQKAEPIAQLIAIFEKEGNVAHPAPGDESIAFNATEWAQYSEAEQRDILMQYRNAYLDYAQVWWCDALGTVLANDEVVNGVSERGGHPVERKRMRQWFLRITSFADRLLDSLNYLEWSEAMKEMQRNWIGKSEGAAVDFKVDQQEETITVFTTRPDTIFGVDFMVLAPEHELVDRITHNEQRATVDTYVQYVKSRSERERMAEKKISGCFTGAYAVHPFSQKLIPIWISEYVLAGYGTGAIMAVPAGDERDFAFAQHFNIPVTNIFGDAFDGTNAVSDKNIALHNSDFINGLRVKEATTKVLEAIVAKNIGQRKINYRLRDAGFSRQRYWGEPFPVLYKNGIPYTINESALQLNSIDQQLPVVLPHVEHYKPGPEGEGPLANVTDWVNVTNTAGEVLKRETNTMPGYAGSSWYFLRYMDPENTQTFAGAEATKYWQQVDLYIGGTEHAVGHLLYSRMWTKALFDLGFINFDEPFKRLLNQGMIQGSTRYVYRIKGTNEYVSEGLKANYETDPIRVDVSMVDGVVLDTEAFKQWREDYKNATFILEEGKYICGVETEKMSKSKYNVVNPDDIVAQYGADTFRMYEMFLGPIEMSKPWDTKGIEGVHRFLKKCWRLFYDEQQGLKLTDDTPNAAALKALHKSIKKIEQDTERFSFNTAVSQFMILVNELTDLKCTNKLILTDVVKLLAPYAPHMAEYLWQQLGNTNTVTRADFPKWDEQYTVENSKVYPVAVNGKARTEMEFALDADAAEVEKAVLANEVIQKWLEGKTPKKFLYIKGKMINVVI
jgi:leucyl-tRNA synthetase